MSREPARSRRRLGSPIARLVLAGVASIAGLGSLAGTPQAALAEGGASRSPVEHVVVLMQSSHTFDNYFGTFPGADGIPGGTCILRDPLVPDLGCLEPYHLEKLRTVDLHDGQSIGVAAYNSGRMDGFIAVQNERNLPGEESLGYYDGRDLPLYWNLATEYVLADRFFSSVMGSREANRFYWVAGQAPTGLIPAQGWEFPTIFDRLEDAGVPWKFYIQNYDSSVTYRTQQPSAHGTRQLDSAPLLNFGRFLDDPALNGRIVDLDQYYADLTAGTLPAVSYIVPSGASEHPPGDVAVGQVFATSLVASLMRSTTWGSSMFLVTWDAWGGWYDHVAPPVVDADGYGFRVPALIVSPYAKRGTIDSTPYDYTSILRFIEDNWSLDPLTSRDATANNVTTALDFNATPRAGQIPGPSYPDRPDVEARNRDVLTLVYTVALGGAVLLLGGLTLGRRRKTGSIVTPGSNR